MKDVLIAFFSDQRVQGALITILVAVATILKTAADRKKAVGAAGDSAASALVSQARSQESEGHALVAETHAKDAAVSADVAQVHAERALEASK